MMTPMFLTQIRSFMLPGLIGFVLIVIPILFQSQSALAQELRIELTDAEGNALENAVIELILPADLKSSYQTVLADVIDQQDKEFVPAVTVVPAGSEINFPNSDDILHHVYSFSPAKTFNIPLYGQGRTTVLSRLFLSQALSRLAVISTIGCSPISTWRSLPCMP